MIVTSPTKTSLAELLESLGDVPSERIRLIPPIGTATVKDVIRIREKEDRLCELMEGVLVEKTMGAEESGVASYLVWLLNSFVIPQNLGKVLGPDGTLRILVNLVYIPDVSFIAWDRFPDRRMPKVAVPSVVPNLAAEILSKGNTRKEMAIKRHNYFKAGVELVWEVDPKKRTVVVYTSMKELSVLTIDDTLDGGTVLPGFELPVKDLFAELDRHG
jgi:Uma2 family endonuclease